MRNGTIHTLQRAQVVLISANLDHNRHLHVHNLENAKELLFRMYFYQYEMDPLNPSANYKIDPLISLLHPITLLDNWIKHSHIRHFNSKNRPHIQVQSRKYLNGQIYHLFKQPPQSHRNSMINSTRHSYSQSSISIHHRSPVNSLTALISSRHLHFVIM